MTAQNSTDNSPKAQDARQGTLRRMRYKPMQMQEIPYALTENAAMTVVQAIAEQKTPGK